MPFLRPLAAPTALLAGLAGALVSTEPASADSSSANVVAAVSAGRNILPTSGWSDVEVFVRNDGAVPAAAVTVTLTLPPELRPFTSESTSDWNCDWGTPAMTCTYIGDLAPGASERVIRRSVAVEGAQTGAALEVSATATTSTPESSTADNTASRLIHIVESGEIRGHLWNDLNADGIRQANEPPATSVGMSIHSQDDEDSYGFSNTSDGTYRESVPSKRFKIVTNLIRSNWRFTKPDVGSDDTDSDLRLVSETTYSGTGESPVFPVDATTPAVLDLGVVAAFRPTKIAPASARQGTTALVTLTGESFTSDLQVKLTRSGSDPIAGVVTNVAADGMSMDVSFPVAQAATGAWTLVLDREYGPHAEVADAFVVTLPQLQVVAAPSITGTVAVGSTVKAVPGTWTPAATSYAYQWAANGVAIRGATGASLPIPASLLGKRLTVKVTALRAGYSSGTASSAASAAVAKGKAPKATKKPSITGTAKVGRTVRAVAGTWSPKADSYRYEWRLNGKAVRGATGATLKLTAAMRDKKLTVTVIARKAGYADGRATSAAVTVRK